MIGQKFNIYGKRTHTWSFKVDTTGVSTTNCIAGIPITLYNQPNASLTVKWGDGTSSVLTSEEWLDWNSEANLHAYETPGEYEIQLVSSDWDSIYIDTQKITSNKYGVMNLNTTTTTRYPSLSKKARLS